MSRWTGFLCLIAAVGAVTPAIAQQQQQMPSATDPLGNSMPKPGLRPQVAPLPPQPPQPQSTQGPVNTLKANAQLVIVDVVATDNKGVAIHNLKASDFTVLEDGTAQQVKEFEEHVAAPPQKARPAMPHLPPGIFTNYTPVPPGSAVNVLLLDALNTQMKDQMYVRQQLLDFLNKTPPGTNIAIFGLNDRLILLQGFTSNLEALKMVVEKSRASSSLLLADSTGNGSDLNGPVSQQISNVMGDAVDMAQLMASVQQFEAVQASTDSQIRAKATLDAMNQLAHFLSGIPGRKNLIWFSGSFPLTVLPDLTGVEHPFEVVGDAGEEARDTEDLLARSEVSVYPVLAYGLPTTNTPIGTTPTLSNLSNAGIIGTLTKVDQANFDQQNSVKQIASRTGGQAYVDGNGLSEAVGKAIENGANYYTLTYTPTNAKQNGAFRKIQVKLARPGVNLSYRTGYFAEDAKAKHGAEMGTNAQQPSSFVKAMLRGAPDATGILMKLQVLPITDTTESLVAKGNALSTEPGAKAAVKGPFRRYAIDIAADERDVQITPTPDGHYQFAVEVLTLVYDASGTIVNRVTQRARGNLSLAVYANMARVGLPFHQEVSVPATGEYYLRTAVHDLETDHFGAVEIPVASVSKLAPLTASAAAPAPGGKTR